MATLEGELIAGLAGQPPQMAAQGVPSAWDTYVNVDNVDAATARAKAAGAQVAMPPMDVGDAGLVNEPGALIWNEVYAPDTRATADFYKQVFGWETGAIPFGDGQSYTTFMVGDAVVGGTAPPDSPTGKIAFLRDPTGASFSIITASQG